MMFKSAYQKPLLHILLYFLTFVVFSPVLFNHFVWTWDDAVYVLENPLVLSTDLRSVVSIFTSSVNQVYSPLTVLSFALEYKLFGLNAWVFHFNNLLLHLVVSGLVFRLALELKLSEVAAFVAALFFAIHPMHVESVAWISERKDVLYAVFYLWAVLEYIQFVRHGNQWRFLASLFLGFLSMLAKPMALSLPLILLALDWFMGRNLNVMERLKEKMFYFMYIVPLTLGSYWSLERIQGTCIQKALIWIYSFVFYVSKFLVPWNLSPHYELPQPVLLSHPAYMGALFLILIFIWSLFSFRKSKWYVFSWLYYILSIFFLLRVHNVMNMSTANFSQVADRFMYLPSVGFCLWVGAVTQFFVKGSSRNVYCVFLVLLVGLFALQSFMQCRVWKDDIALWSYAIEKNSQDPLPYLNRARAYEKAGQYTQAIADDTQAININPQYYISELGGKYPEADQQRIDEINARLLNNPHYVVGLRHRGRLYEAIGDHNKALADFNEILRIDPVDQEALDYLMKTDQVSDHAAIGN